MAKSEQDKYYERLNEEAAERKKRDKDEELGGHSPSIVESIKHFFRHEED